jgi:hypothetical protein
MKKIFIIFLIFILGSCYKEEKINNKETSKIDKKIFMATSSQGNTLT